MFFKDDNLNFVQSLLTDFYQLTMIYAYWKKNKHNDHAVFELFFRENPFKGEFTVFSGLEEVLWIIKDFRFTESDINYLKTNFSETTEPEFFDYLMNLNTKNVKVFSIKEGTICFPREPLIRIEGPLAITQLLESVILNEVNYSSAVATRAARFRIAAGDKIKLYEMGLRRASGLNGALSSSRSAFLGGFDATSNVLAGKLYGVPLIGSIAHSFIMSHFGLNEIKNEFFKHSTTNNEINFVNLVKSYRVSLASILKISISQSSEGELAAFISYATSFPNKFLVLLDTYDVLRSGILNFCCVSLALNELNYTPIGVRIDSGDLAYLSKKIREIFNQLRDHYNLKFFDKLEIIASGDIDEETIYSLNDQGHQITAYGIGTKLVNCQIKPPLGCVYKLVEINKKPCIKLSNNLEKITIPCSKTLYRLYSMDGIALIDLMLKEDEELNTCERILCRHPFHEHKRAYVELKKLKKLLEPCLIFIERNRLTALKEAKENFLKSIKEIRADHFRFLNPTPYKVSVSSELYKTIHDLWLKHSPIENLL